MLSRPLVKQLLRISGIVLLLGLPLVVLKTLDRPQGLSLAYRPELLIELLVVILGCFLIHQQLIKKIAYKDYLPDFPIKDYWQNYHAQITQYLVLGALIFPLLAGRYGVDLATYVLIYCMLGFSLSIIVGFAGLLDLGFVAFYGIGAYGYALLNLHEGLGFWTSLPVVGLMAAAVAFVIGYPILRLRGDYFAIVTLGLGQIFYILLQNWVSLTKGPSGIAGVPRPEFFGIVFAQTPPAGKIAFHELLNLPFANEQRLVFLYYVILFLTILVAYAVDKMRRSPLGLAWEALREDEIAAKSVGMNPRTIRLSAYMMSAFFAAMAGAFFAARQGFISPESFTFTETGTVLAIVVLGGMGHPLGVVIAAGLLVFLPELFRAFAEYRMLVFGAAMVVIMLIRPRGLFAQRRPALLWQKVRF